jgi:hypothetical protein
MSEVARPADACPTGFPEEQVAGLVGHRDGTNLAAERHVESCLACAEFYLDHLIISQVVREAAGEARSRRPVSIVRPWTGMRRALVAASVLVAATAGAVAAALLLARPVFVTSADVTRRRASEVELRTGLDFDAAGIAPESVVAALGDYVADGGLGTVAVVLSGSERRIDAVAFGAGGAPRWSARRNWADWEETLGARPVEFVGLFNLVTKVERETPRETLLLALERRGTGAIVTIDPRTGERLGAFFHPGALARGDAIRERTAPLPAPIGEERPILVCGRHGVGETAKPCASVIDVQGRVLQHVVFPTLGSSEIEGPSAREARVNWAAGAESVLFVLDDDLLCEVPLRGGRLATAEASYAASDQFAAKYDARKAKGAYDDLVAAKGGRQALFAELARQVHETSLSPQNGWRTR